jgi:hypothetical protein
LAPTTDLFNLNTIAWTGTADVPTEAPASPLYGAQAFTQQLLLFEEFGPELMPVISAVSWTALPLPPNAQNGPNPAKLEDFLKQPGVAPYPSEYSNVTDTNPWTAKIEPFLGRALKVPTDANGDPLPGVVAGPAEGRPSGPDWKQQNWAEFFPQKFFKTAQAPARTNGGFRDGLQRHHYSVGEFGPGGLYRPVTKYHERRSDQVASEHARSEPELRLDL